MARLARVGARARQVGLVVALLLAIATFWVSMNGHVPVSEWLFWRFAGYWFASGTFALLSLTLGDALVTWVRGGRRLPVREQLAMAFPLGALGFGVGVFGCGVLHLFRGGFFFWYPFGLALVFVPRFAFAYWPLLRRLLRPGFRLPKSVAWRAPLFALALLLAYVPLITFRNIVYDATWYHFPAAEHYAAAGGIERFPEGWLLGAYPQLGTLFYSWAMTLPFGRFFDRAMLCVHVEWMMFIGTLLSVPVMVRRLAPKLSGVGGALSMFLFPGMLLYDSSLGGGADHLAAAFAPALWLSLLRAWPRLERRACALFALAFSAAALTKYTALSLVGPVALGFGLRVLWLLAVAVWQRARARVSVREVLTSAALCGALVLCVTSIHWLKNLIFIATPCSPWETSGSRRRRGATMRSGTTNSYRTT
ncbi:MAG: hypothetical protein QM756_16285 [Polyangiaceae bacterium]